MSWSKREAVSNLVILGDDAEKNQKKAGGLLASIARDATYTDNFNYELVQKDGSSILLAGNASINRMIHEKDIGKFVKAEFFGWGKTQKGARFKQIEVQVWDGEPTPEMKKWPRWEELQNGGTPNGKSVKDAVAGNDDWEKVVAEDEDDGLPF